MPFYRVLQTKEKQLLIDRRNTKIKVITLDNHIGGKITIRQIKTRRNYMLMTQICKCNVTFLYILICKALAYDYFYN